MIDDCHLYNESCILLVHRIYTETQHILAIHTANTSLFLHITNLYIFSLLNIENKMKINDKKSILTFNYTQSSVT